METLHEISVIGDIGVGKTALCKKLVHDKFDPHYKATIGCDFGLKIINKEDRTIRLQLWDIAGQERYGNMTRVYYQESHGAFIMCDDRISTIESVKKWKFDIDSKIEWNRLYPENFNPCILLVNKSDSKDSYTETVDFDKICKDNGFNSWMKISCKTGEGIQEACDRMLAILEQLNPHKEIKDVESKIECKDECKNVSKDEKDLRSFLKKIFRITNRATDDCANQIGQLKSIYSNLYFSENSAEFFEKIKECEDDISVIRDIQRDLTRHDLKDSEKCLEIQSYILDYGLKIHTKTNLNSNIKLESKIEKDFRSVLMEIFRITNVCHDNYEGQIIELKETFSDMYFSEKSNEFFDEIKQCEDIINIIKDIHRDLTRSDLEDIQKCMKIQEYILDYGLKYHTK
jgi:Ras-related protein Rab-32